MLRICYFIHYFLLFSDELVRRHVNLTETEFDGVVAEWLRFAKQGKERDDKTKQKENNELNEEHEHDGQH